MIQKKQYDEKEFILILNGILDKRKQEAVIEIEKNGIYQFTGFQKKVLDDAYFLIKKLYTSDSITKGISQSMINDKLYLSIVGKPKNNQIKQRWAKDVVHGITMLIHNKIDKNFTGNRDSFRYIKNGNFIKINTSKSVENIMHNIARTLIGYYTQEQISRWYKDVMLEVALDEM